MTDRSIYYGIGALALVALGSLGCFNDCSFFEQCNGSVLEICGGGPDQQVGREINETKCEGDNPVCVEFSSTSAACVTEAACDPATFEQTCEGSKLRSCVHAPRPSDDQDSPITNARVQVYDCARRGEGNDPYECVVGEMGAQCAPMMSTPQGS